ncbi:histidine phosphatase family protein [Jiangella gansuensis]|uniref:histidine phosphatase family protein n=1 Tax=Jiangella gansuensis TaxID=281473 RepID=UPI00047B3050|nr:histidine phosphatase family protein [Jiangella gansuensis]
MTTYLLRHAETEMSRQYLVNGDPARTVLLSELGVRSCRQVSRELPISRVQTWVTSQFPRAQQTASHLKGQASGMVVVDRRLNELDYGDFEGHTFLDYAAWLRAHGGGDRPPGSIESQREAMSRMVAGLAGALLRPAPRVLVAHGLLVSMVLWAGGRVRSERMPAFFPESPYVRPFALSDPDLFAVVKTLRCTLELDRLRDRRSADRAKRVSGAAQNLATFDRPAPPSA